MSIVIAIVVFGLIILVHELGHFWAARRYGILVTEFAIGMGPKIFSTKPEPGQTMYSLRLFPIGGFCLMHGDDADPMVNEDDEEVEVEIDKSLYEGRSLNSKPVYQRLAVMFAGSFMNFVLAFLLFTMLAGLTVTRTTSLSHISPNSPAEAAGLAVGDRIISLNGSRIFLWDDITFETSTGYGRPIEIGFIRDGQRHSVNITPMPIDNRFLIGISPVVRAGWIGEVPEGFYRISILEAATDGIMRIEFVIRTTLVSLTRIITSQMGLEHMAGPIGIVTLIDGNYRATVEAATEAQVGLGILILSVSLNMASLGALMSTSIGLFNLLPLPALDGGRMVFLLIEGMRGKPISPEREGMVHLTGFALLIILAVFIAYQDILNLL